MKTKNLVLLLGLTLSIQVYSADSCNELFESQPVGHYLRKNVLIPTEGESGIANKLLVQKAVKDITGVEFKGTTFDGAIEKVFQHLNSKNVYFNDVAKAKKMTEFAKALNPVFEAMLLKVPAKGTQNAPDLVAWRARKEVLDKVKTVKYNISRKVSKLEEFSHQEFKVVLKDEIILSRGKNLEKLTHMKMKDYPAFVDSYIHGLKDSSHPKAALFNNIDEGDLGILSIGDIRDITAYNVWPMYYKSHDIKHIHYSLSHPMALASMMGTTRSKNNLRYVIQAGLYEGVDRVQYSHETNLNAFFSNQIKSDEVFGIKRSMDLEEAMLTVANATDEELKHLAKISEDAASFVTRVGNWAPKRTLRGKLRGAALDGETFEQEIDNMVAQYSGMLRRSEKIHKRLIENPKLVLSPQEEHFMKMMNFQLDPNEPEIVIEGLRYKNDGRAHVDRWSTVEDVNIGIGNQ